MDEKVYNMDEKGIQLGLEAIALHGSNDSFYFSYLPFHCHSYSIE